MNGDDTRTVVCPKCGTVNEVDAKKAVFSLVVCTKCEHHFYTTATNTTKGKLL